MSDADTETSRPEEVIDGRDDENSAGEQSAVRNEEEPLVSTAATPVFTNLTGQVLIEKEEWERLKKVAGENEARIQSDKQKKEEMKRKLEEYEAQLKQPTPPAVEKPPAKKIKEEPPEEVETAPEAAVNAQNTTMPEEHAIESPVETAEAVVKEVKKEYEGMGDNVYFDASALEAELSPPAQPQPVTKVSEAMMEHNYSAPKKEVKKECKESGPPTTVKEKKPAVKAKGPVKKRVNKIDRIITERESSSSNAHDDSLSATSDAYDSDASNASWMAPRPPRENRMPENISLWIVHYVSTVSRNFGYPKLFDFIDAPLTPDVRRKMMPMMSSMWSLYKNDPSVSSNGVTMDQAKNQLTFLKEWVLHGGYVRKTLYFASIKKVAQIFDGEEGLERPTPFNQRRIMPGSKSIKKEIKEEPSDEGTK